MKKLLLSSLCTFFLSFGFAQRGTNYHPNFQFPINYELGEIIFETGAFYNLNNQNFMTIEEAENKSINGTVIFKNKGLKSLEGLQYFKDYQQFNFSNNPLEDISVLDTMNISLLTMENTGITKLNFFNFIGVLRVKNNPNLDSICIPRVDFFLAPVEKDEHTKIYCAQGDGTYGDCPEPLSTNAIRENSEASFYPNPATDYLTITNNKANQASVIALDGTTLMTKKIKNNHLDISSLPKGQYILHIITGSEVVTETFVKE